MGALGCVCVWGGASACAAGTATAPPPHASRRTPQPPVLRMLPPALGSPRPAADSFNAPYHPSDSAAAQEARAAADGEPHAWASSGSLSSLSSLSSCRGSASQASPGPWPVHPALLEARRLRRLSGHHPSFDADALRLDADGVAGKAWREAHKARKAEEERRRRRELERQQECNGF